MKIAIFIVDIILIILEIGMLISFRHFCRKHRKEKIETHTKDFYSRLTIISVIGVWIVILGVVIKFV